MMTFKKEIDGEMRNVIYGSVNIYMKHDSFGEESIYSYGPVVDRIAAYEASGLEPEEFKATHDDLKKENEKLSNKIEALRHANGKLGYELSILNQSNANLRTENEALEKTNKELDKRCEELQYANDTQTKTIHDLKATKIVKTPTFDIDIDETIRKIATDRNISLTVTTTKDGHKSVSVYPYPEESISEEVKERLEDLYYWLDRYSFSGSLLLVARNTVKEILDMLED